MKLLYLANIRLPTEKAHGVQIMKTCEALARAGVDVELMVSSRHTDVAEDPFAYYGITTRFTITRVPVLDLVRWERTGFAIETLSFVFSALRMLRKKEFDVLYGRQEAVLRTMLLFGFHAIVWEIHGNYSWSWYARSLARHARAFVVISNGLRSLLLGWGVPQQKIFVAPDAVDLDAFAHPESKDGARHRLGLPSDKPIMMYIGRLDERKGSVTFCEAAGLLGEKVQAVVIGGEPDQVADFKARYPGVTFLGFKPYKELPDNQAAADVLVLPTTGADEISMRFTSPLKLFSYMASGRPIVASDVSSVREVLTEENAYFAEMDNPRSFADGVLHLLQNPEEAERLAEQALRDIRKYSWEHRAHTILEAIGMK